ncbi:MAG: hypothetical protein HGA24_00125 [Candidatus Aminicenantes bacterium]|nr:hypothetical protein [Candidatus Aminicenantes bacterium]
MAKRGDLIVTRRDIRISGLTIPVVRIAGTLPSGSKGNDKMSACFRNVSNAVDFQESSSRKIVYDMTDLRYDFGDHLGAFLWNLPALLDGISILVATTGRTRDNLESLSVFIGPWLPIAFFESVELIAEGIREDTKMMAWLEEKRKVCSQQGQSIPPRETGTAVVVLGSRQTGHQFRTHNEPLPDADLDCGVIGGPRQLAILTLKMSDQPVSKVKHPPIRTYASAHDAVSQGLFIIMPERR